MLVIRMTRRGRRNDPAFRLVVCERSNPVKGKFLEELGFYNPKLKSKSFDKERILHWISKGAKCSATVNNLLISEKVIEGKKVKAWRPKKKDATSETVKEEKQEKNFQGEPEGKKEPAEPTVNEDKKEEKNDEPPQGQETEKSA